MLPVDTWCFSRIHTTFGRCRRKYCKQLIMEPRIELATCLFVLPTTFYWLIIAPQKPATQPPRPAPLVPLTVFGNLHLFTLCVISLKIQFLQSGAFRVAKHRGAYISFISWSIYKISDPAPCEVYKLVLQMFQKLCWKVIFPERRKEFPR